jgi:hypothetical protein
MGASLKRMKSFCFFVHKEDFLFFFEKKNQKTFTHVTCAGISVLRPVP